MKEGLIGFAIGFLLGWLPGAFVRWRNRRMWRQLGRALLKICNSPTRVAPTTDPLVDSKLPDFVEEARKAGEQAAASIAVDEAAWRAGRGVPLPGEPRYDDVCSCGHVLTMHVHRQQRPAGYGGDCVSCSCMLFTPTPDPDHARVGAALRERRHLKQLRPEGYEHAGHDVCVRCGAVDPPPPERCPGPIQREPGRSSDTSHQCEDTSCEGFDTIDGH